MLDFRRLCEEYRIPLADKRHHHTSKGWLQTHCPHCSDRTSGWHLGFNLNRGYFHCWRCGAVNFYSTLQKLLATNNPARVREMVANFFVSGSGEASSKETHRMGKVKLPSGVVAMRRAHKTYLRNRGYDPDEIAATWGVRGTMGLSGKWSWRLIIPVYSQTGMMVSYLGRAIHDQSKPRYRTAEDSSASKSVRDILYGMQYMQQDYVIVTEGPTDVWRLGPGAVATMGAAWTIEHARLLSIIKRRIIVFDPDPAGRRRSERLAAWLSVFPGSTELVDDLPCDPGGLSEKQVRKLKRMLRLGD